MNQISIILHTFLGTAKMTKNKHSKYSVHSVQWGKIEGSDRKETLFYTTDDKQKVIWVPG